jgi:hypothetical protein
MDLVLHGLVWAGLLAATLWLVSFWPRWVASDLGLPARMFLMRPWMRGLAPYSERWPFVSLAFYAHLWRSGRILEFVLAVIAVLSIFRAASAFFKTAAAVVRTGA